MRIPALALVVVLVGILSSCASRYQLIEPESLNYLSVIESGDVKLEYKYDLLNKKYAKREPRKEVRLVAVRISNNSDRDLVFGRDLKLTYGNGTVVGLVDNDKVYKKLRQRSYLYSLYLLLTPMKLNIEQNGSSTTSDVGLILGPGIAGGNLLVSILANRRFKMELLTNNLNHVVIKKGETRVGLVGIRTKSAESLYLEVN